MRRDYKNEVFRFEFENFTVIITPKCGEDLFKWATKAILKRKETLGNGDATQYNN